MPYILYHISIGHKKMAYKEQSYHIEFRKAVRAL